MLDDYYEARGWDRKTGIPTQTKIAELELEEEMKQVFPDVAQNP
ncbi:MAG: aldehyde ferredoxin oxidoreductase C-terminal domain-containing protein [Pseudomonadota bacterium]